MTTTPATSALAEALDKLAAEREGMIERIAHAISPSPGENAYHDASNIVQNLPDHILVERAAWERLIEVIGDGIEAFRLTREYVGLDLLPEIDGWSWFDWCQKARAALAPQPDAAQEPKP